MEGIYHLTGVYSFQNYTWKKITLLLILVGSGLFVWESSKFTVPPMGSVQLLFLGEQTGIWLEEGDYFIWFHELGLIKLQLDEAQSHEINDIYVDTFETRDINGKMIKCKIDGDWVIADHDRYKLIKATDIKRNLTSGLEKAVTTFTGSKEFEADLLGKNHGDDINDNTFRNRMRSRFGIEFENIDCIIISGDLVQDNLNNYRDKLTDKYKTKHPTMSDKEISELVEVQLKLAKKVISNSPLVNRYDVT